MSSQSVVAPSGRGAAASVVAGVGRARATAVALILTLGAVASATVVLWQPWGGRNQFSYAVLAQVRDAAWTGVVIDGIGIAAIGVGLGLAACMLAPRRGGLWATVGAVVCGLGGVVFSGGAIAFGVLVWYATATDAIPADAGAALLTYVETNLGHVAALQMSGFVLFTVGSLLLMVALWRARAVPRWLPIGYAVLTVALFSGIENRALDVVQAVQLLTLLVVAWYLRRGTPARTE